MLDELGRLVHVEVDAEHRDAQSQPSEVVVAGPVLAGVLVYRLDCAPVGRDASRDLVRGSVQCQPRLEASGRSSDALLDVRGGIARRQASRRETHARRGRFRQAIDTEGPPVVTATIPGDEIPAAAAITARWCGSTVGPGTGSVNVAAPRAPTRRRKCAGRTCSSFTRARTAGSSIPLTEARAAVPRPTAIAIASSSSSSSGGIAVPARSRYPPVGPVSDSTG